MVHAYAKSHEGKTLAELEAMKEHWIAGSEQRAGVLLAMEWLKKAEQQESDARTERHHSERQQLAKVAAAISLLGALAAWTAFAVARLAPNREIAEMRTEIAAVRQQVSALTATPLSQPATTAPPRQSTATLAPAPSANTLSTPVPQVATPPPKTP